MNVLYSASKSQKLDSNSKLRLYNQNALSNFEEMRIFDSVLTQKNTATMLMKFYSQTIRDQMSKFSLQNRRNSKKR